MAFVFSWVQKKRRKVSSIGVVHYAWIRCPVVEALMRRRYHIDNHDHYSDRHAWQSAWISTHSSVWQCTQSLSGRIPLFTAADASTAERSITWEKYERQTMRVQIESTPNLSQSLIPCGFGPHLESQCFLSCHQYDRSASARWCMPTTDRCLPRNLLLPNITLAITNAHSIHSPFSRSWSSQHRLITLNLNDWSNNRCDTGRSSLALTISDSGTSSIFRRRPADPSKQCIASRIRSLCPDRPLTLSLASFRLLNTMIQVIATQLTSIHTMWKPSRMFDHRIILCAPVLQRSVAIETSHDRFRPTVEKACSHKCFDTRQILWRPCGECGRSSWNLGVVRMVHIGNAGTTIDRARLFAGCIHNHRWRRHRMVEYRTHIHTGWWHCPMHLTWIIDLWCPLLTDEITIDANDSVTDSTREKACCDHLCRRCRHVRWPMGESSQSCLLERGRLDEVVLRWLFIGTWCQHIDGWSG